VSEITAFEWQMAVKVLIGIVVLGLGMLGLIVAVVKWQLGTLAKGQTLLFSKFNEGGEVHDLSIRVRRIENILMRTNADDTIITRAILGGDK